MCGRPASPTHHAFASCCHWANVRFHHLHPPSPQTLVPLRFTKGPIDTPEKGLAPPAVEPLSDLGDPYLWTSCGLSPWDRQTSSKVTFHQSAPSPSHPAPGLPSPLPRKAEAALTNRAHGVPPRLPIDNQELSNHVVFKIKRQVIPETALITTWVVAQPSFYRGPQRTWSAAGPGGAAVLAIDHVCVPVEFIISLMLLLV